MGKSLPYIILIFFANIFGQTATLLDTIAFVGESISIPIFVDDVDEQLEGLEFVINYNDTVLTANSATISNTELESLDYLITSNFDVSGTVSIIVYAGAQLVIPNDGELVYLEFTAIGDALETSSISFESFEVNNIDASFSDGNITLHNPGCMDMEACNYDESATFDDGSCAALDCAGECAGSSLYGEWGNCCLPESLINVYLDQDGDGLGSGNPVNICQSFTQVGWVTNNYDVDDFCFANWYDCNGECSGSAVEDDCGVCVEGATGNSFNYLMDECGICEGPGKASYYPDYDGDGLGSGDAESYCDGENPEGWVDNNTDENPYCPNTSNCGESLMDTWNLIYWSNFDNPSCAGMGMFNSPEASVSFEFSVLTDGLYQIDVDMGDESLSGVWFMPNDGQFCMLSEDDMGMIDASGMNTGGGMDENESTEIEEDRETECFGIRFEDEFLILTNPDEYSCTQYVLTSGNNVLPEPSIASIQDLPLDQGGFVQILFDGSVYDSQLFNYNISYYSIWREVGEDDCESAGGEYWELLGEISTPGPENQYAFTAPTICTSTEDVEYFTTYQIIAHTSNSNIYYSSNLMAGSSVDNLAPEIPTLSSIESNNDEESITLFWNENGDGDFSHFNLYRGVDIDSIELLESLIDTSYIDSNINKDTKYYYGVTAIDIHGNESSVSQVLSGEISQLSISNELPHKFELFTPYPNPFNPITHITYSLPKYSWVKLDVYSLDGKLVERLVDIYQGVGLHSIYWTPQNVSSGAYIIRLKWDENVMEEKVLFIK